MPQSRPHIASNPVEPPERAGAGHSGTDAPDAGREKIWELIKTLVVGEASADDILEYYYWSRDPELLAALRTLVVLRDAERQRLLGYLARHDGRTLRVLEDAGGGLILRE